MGCWNETCAVTRIPIWSGDKVVMIVVREGTKPELLMSSYYTMYRAIEQIEHGTYNDYGWIEEVFGATSPDMEKRMRGEEEPYERAIFVLQSVWDRILKVKDEEFSSRYNRLMEGMEREKQDHLATLKHLGGKEGEGDKGDDWWKKFESWIKVMVFCHQCRVNPLAGLAFKGCQHYNILLYKELLNIEKTQLVRWIKQEKEWADGD